MVDFEYEKHNKRKNRRNKSRSPLFIATWRKYNNTRKKVKTIEVQIRKIRKGIIMNNRKQERRQNTRRIKRKKTIRDISYIGILTSKVFFPKNAKKTKWVSKLYLNLIKGV